MNKVVTSFSEFIITLGVFFGLFFIWQNVYTDIEVHATQKQLIEELNWTKPTPQPQPQSEPQSEPSPHVDPKQYGPTPKENTGEHKDIIATLHIPRISSDYEQAVSNGINKKEILDARGLGWYPDTVGPGQPGNMAIAGHRSTYGRPFWDIDKLEIEDTLILRTAENWYVYKVINHKIVKPNQVEVLASNMGDSTIALDSGRSFITLTACHPKYSRAERYIVHGELEYWMPVSSGIPTELQEGNN